MKNISQILLPVDFSEGSKEASKYALQLCGVLNARLRVLHVIDVGAALTYGDMWTAPPMFEAIEKAAIQQLHDFVRDFDTDVPHTLFVEEHGMSVADAICKDAKVNHCDMIVMATHGRKGMDHFLLGSVAEKVVRAAPCPVMTMRAGSTEN